MKKYYYISYTWFNHGDWIYGGKIIDEHPLDWVKGRDCIILYLMMKNIITTKVFGTAKYEIFHQM